MFGAASRHDQVFYRGFEAHAQELRRAAGLLAEAFGEAPDLPDIRGRMREVRSSGERHARGVICELRKTWITPFDPQDIRELILGLDSVLELILAAVERVEAFELHNINGESEGALRLTVLLSRCCDSLDEAIKLMAQKKTETKILEICAQLRGLEHEADEIYRQAIVTLFGHTQDVRDVMKWHEVFDKIEAATNRCGQMAQEVETIVEGHA
jgi:uncharacterized protein Yka (UPF0111/DUF47 family)